MGSCGNVIFHGTAGLKEGLATLGGPAGVVSKISTTIMGPIGGVLALLGVVAAPITSGDTAFRSVRLTLSDILHLEQGSVKKRLLLAVPIIAVGAILTQINFDMLWRYLLGPIRQWVWYFIGRCCLSCKTL